MTPCSFLSAVHSCDQEQPRPCFLWFLLLQSPLDLGASLSPGWNSQGCLPQEATPSLIALLGPSQFGGSPLPARKQKATRSPCPWGYPMSVASAWSEAMSVLSLLAQQAWSCQRGKAPGECGRSPVVLKPSGSCCSRGGHLWLPPDTEPWTTAPKRHTQWGLRREHREANSFPGLLSSAPWAADRFCWPCHGVQTEACSGSPAGGSEALGLPFPVEFWILSALAP